MLLSADVIAMTTWLTRLVQGRSDASGTGSLNAKRYTAQVPTVGIELQPQMCGGNETSCKYIHLAHRLIVPRCVSERWQSRVFKLSNCLAESRILSPGSSKDPMADMVGRLNSRQLTWKICHQSCRKVRYDTHGR